MFEQSDYTFQLQFVVDNAWRLIAMQDQNPLAPSHGCFDYRYWRDKTAEFADARFQEASLTLALLSMPEYDEFRSGDRLPGAAELYQAFKAGLHEWSRAQYPNGCFDEWYKGERGFAATCCTTIAFGLAAHFLGDRMEPADREIVVATVFRACEWLSPRHDQVKTNHTAVAAAALAIGYRVTGCDAFRRRAREKVDIALSRQHPEGWFPEVGGMDLGYCSVLLDYIMLYVHFCGDEDAIPAMRRLMTFMLPHMHPDGTISPEAGSCLNPYVCRVGTGLLSHYDDNAAASVSLFSRWTPGKTGLRAGLADDLRFARWSHLPVLAHILRRSFRVADDASLEPRFPLGWTIRRGCALAAFHQGTLHIYFSVAGGGAVRVFLGRELVVDDLGVYAISGDDKLIAGYHSSRPIECDGNSVTMRTTLGRATFFYPSFLSRTILRIGSTTAWGSALLRWGIDWYRVRNGTAVNQSASPVVKHRANLQYERSVMTDGQSVTIIDHIERPEPQPAPLDMELRYSSKLPASVTRSNQGETGITVTKRFDI